jgi:hypothetical protein
LSSVSGWYSTSFHRDPVELLLAERPGAVAAVEQHQVAEHRQAPRLQQEQNQRPVLAQLVERPADPGGLRHGLEAAGFPGDQVDRRACRGFVHGSRVPLQGPARSPARRQQ